jgi:hypothetical protein
MPRGAMSDAPPPLATGGAGGARAAGGWAVALLAGLLDLPAGVLGKIASIFWRPPLPARADSPRRRCRGLALIVGGIEGPSPYNYAMGMGLLLGRYRGAVVRFDWNDGIPFLRSLVNLASRRHHEAQSRRLASAIADHLALHPGSPVCLLAQSGGCWIAARALEELPPTAAVDIAVFLAASVSPGRDLERAAGRCRRGLWSVGGPGDYFFLGLGTLLLGTSDRVFTPAAGLVGWRRPPPGLVELSWRPAWVRFGYLGNHTTSSSAGFIRRIIAPLLMAAAPARTGPA